MTNKNFISKDHFLKRIVDLCLRSGLSGFPKDDVDQHILLKSVILVIRRPGTMTEQEINEKLKLWCHLTQIKGIDHGTLRRRLVDTGYLARNKDGSTYQLCSDDAGKYAYETTIDQIDFAEAITAAREEIERRKRSFMEKSSRT